MCKFFSAISDGKGKVLFFKEKDVAQIMAEGNPKNYSPNSHTSIADFNGIKGEKEDKWNKWEYDVQTRTLKLDNKNTVDDSEKVKKVIEKFLKGKDTGVLRNLYGLNTGDSNTGYRNTGDSNTGDRNTGNWNKCDRETGFFNSKSSETINVFNKPCKIDVWEKATLPRFFFFDKNVWITSDEMTPEQKTAHPEHITTGGCLTVLETAEAWKLAWFKATKNDKKLLFNLPNFNAEVFKEITGIDVTK